MLIRGSTEDKNQSYLTFYLSYLSLLLFITHLPFIIDNRHLGSILHFSLFKVTIQDYFQML